MIYPLLQQAAHEGRKQLAVLVDPGKCDDAHLSDLASMAVHAGVDYFFVGGSLLLNNELEQTIALLKKVSGLPVILFPGSSYQLSNKADAVLFLSLISGRNPEYLIGQQVTAAPMIKTLGLETISTGYILVDGGAISSTSYITQTIPLPHHKPELAVATALAGEMLGMQLIYLEAGSGAKRPVSEPMIAAVKKNIRVPLLVGGGIRTAHDAEAAAKAGADVVVIGNVLEKDRSLLFDLAGAVKG